MVVTGEALLAGVARGPVLRIARPLSFWGGVDPRSGRITDPANDATGREIGGTILMLAATRGSSSSSSVMLELIVAGRAPAAVVVDTIDAILGLGIVVARELGHHAPPLLRLPIEQQSRFVNGENVALFQDGRIERV